MNIAFDALAILGKMSKNRGIGNYALSQFRTMIEMDKENNYFFFNCVEPFAMFDNQSNPENYQEEYFYLGENYYLANTPEFVELYGALIRQFIKKNSIDVFYITSPFEDGLPNYKKEWLDNTAVIVTVYDIIPYVFKDVYLSDGATRKWYINRCELFSWCDKILVISESVKSDLIKYLNCDATKIECIWGAVDSRFEKIEITNEDRSYFTSKYGIQPDFIMCTGGDDERKNIGGLIEAYSCLDDSLKNGHQLVIVCKLSQEAINKYTNLAKKLHIQKNIILTNFVTNDELLKLYNMAYLMAFPSKYEGFGLPIVEAYACGTPVLTSNNSSLIEIAGESAYIVDPFKIESITAGLEKALSDKNIDDVVKSGYKQLEKFRWNVVAESAINTINTIKLREKHNASICPTLAFFSPLPPVQSGISDYSVDILNVLCQYFKITVFIDDGYEPVVDFHSDITIENHNRFEQDKYDYVIFQYGNNTYHHYMDDYIVNYGGIVVLHDYNLHGSMANKTLYSSQVDFELYKKCLYEDYSKEFVDAYIHRFQSGKVACADKTMPANGYIVNYADKIIVHSQENKEKLLTKNIEHDVTVINSYAKIEPLNSVSYAKHILNIEDTQICIAAFGHIQESKRVIPILKAIALLKKDGYNFKMYFCGKIETAFKPEFERVLNQMELQGVVSVTGYISLEDFLRYLDATDICLNLRYPYNGETSGALMRILAKGKCVLVNDIGAFSEIPDECCIKLPDVNQLSEDDEINTIYKTIKNLIQNKEIMDGYGRNARKYAETNLDINIIGKEYRNVILRKKCNYITESTLKKLKRCLDCDNNLKYKNMCELVRTLGYIKNNQYENGKGENNNYNSENQGRISKRLEFDNSEYKINNSNETFIDADDTCLQKNNALYQAKKKTNILSSLYQRLLKHSPALANSIKSNIYKLAGKQYQEEEKIEVTLADPMRKSGILIDLSTITRSNPKTGIQRVVYNIYKELSNSEYRVFGVRDWHGKLVSSNRYICARENRTFNHKEQEFCLKNKDVLLMLDSSWDLYYDFSQILQNAKKNYCKVYGVVYDLFPVQYPKLFTSAEFRESFNMWHRMLCEYCDGIICISKTTADIMEMFYERQQVERRTPLNIYSFSLGVDINVTQSDARYEIKEFVGERPTFLMVGTVEPRKGHLVVLKALENVTKRDVNILIIGRDGWKNDEIKRVLSNRSISNRVLWIKDATDNELAWAYKNCSALIAASQDEGYGLPLIEAAYYETHIICSDIPIFHEVTGDNATFFKTMDSDALAKTIDKWLEDDNHPDSGKIELVTWKDSAQEIVDIIDEKIKPYKILQ